MFYWAKSSDMSWQSKVHIETYSLFNKHYSAYQARWLADSDVIKSNILTLLGSFSNDDGDGGDEAG